MRNLRQPFASDLVYVFFVPRHNSATQYTFMHSTRPTSNFALRLCRNGTSVRSEPCILPSFAEFPRAGTLACVSRKRNGPNEQVDYSKPSPKTCASGTPTTASQPDAALTPVFEPLMSRLGAMLPCAVRAKPSTCVVALV